VNPPVSYNEEVMIEISVNEGQQYTDFEHKFYYRELDSVASVSPSLGSVFGSTYLTLTYNIFFSTSGIDQASCKFTDGVTEVETRIVAIDTSAETVSCYTPPAELISTTLFSSGGSVSIYISSNSIDYSTDSVAF